MYHQGFLNATLQSGMTSVTTMGLHATANAVSFGALCRAYGNRALGTNKHSRHDLLARQIDFTGQFVSQDRPHATGP